MLTFRPILARGKTNLLRSISTGALSGGAASLAAYYTQTRQDQETGQQILDVITQHRQGIDGELLERQIAAVAPAERNVEPELRADADPMVLAAFGIDPSRPLTQQEVANLLGGQRADGGDLPGYAREYAAVDLCLSPDKSLDLAWAFAPTAAEAAMIHQCHREAGQETMAYIAGEMGRAAKGKGGKEGRVPGHVVWLGFDHFTARPTLEMVVTDPVTGQQSTELHRMDAVVGDPKLHTHFLMLNLVAAEGRNGSLDFQRLRGRVKEYGAFYQMRLATKLKALGVDVVLDRKTGAARVKSIPQRARDAFSRRTRDAETAARDYAWSKGLVWSKLDDAAKAKLLKGGARASRQDAMEGGNDRAVWKLQAAALGWMHKSVLNLNRPGLVLEAQERADRAYEIAQPMLSDLFQNKAVVTAADIRTVAARALIETGGEGRQDIDRVTALFRERGITQNKQNTRLRWSEDRNKLVVNVTTELHADQERELLRLMDVAKTDRSRALSEEEIGAAIRGSGLDFSSPIGREQVAAIHENLAGGRLGLVIGPAGSGKSYTFSAMVHAWAQDGRDVHGISLAHRQADDLRWAGIRSVNAVEPFLRNLERGKLVLTDRSVVVLDEAFLLGTRQALRLMQQQERMGFAVMMAGDPRQGQSIEAGAIAHLLEKTFAGRIPEITHTIRQRSERERETALMFREGRAKDALDRKVSDDTLVLVPGGYQQAVQKAADLWDDRRKTNLGSREYTLSISAPTNASAQDISKAIREKRRVDGELGGVLGKVAAIDQNGASYEMTLERGDRLRLFDKVRGRDLDGKRVKIGNNGSVITVRGLDRKRMHVVTVEGVHATLDLKDIVCKHSDRLRIAYGDCLTIDAAQGLTSTEHISAMPGGSNLVDGYKGYVANSRGRGDKEDEPKGLHATYLLTSEGQEMLDIIGKRGPDREDPISRDEVIENIARNLSRQPEKTLAMSVVDAALATQQAATRALQQTYQRVENRVLQGQPFSDYAKQRNQQREDRAVSQAMQRLEPVIGRVEASVARVERFQQVGISMREERDLIKSMLKDRTEKVAEKILGKPTDRQGNSLRYGKHGSQSIITNGVKRGQWYDHERKVGGSLLDMVAQNNGVELKDAMGWARDWLKLPEPDHNKGLSPEDVAHMRAAQEARAASDARKRAAEEQHTLARQATVARRCAFVYENSMPANPNHPYLKAKGLTAEFVQEAGWRQDRRGRVRISLHGPDGEVKNIQTIDKDGNKRFQRGGQVSGLYHMLGDTRAENAITVSEGAATGGTVRMATNMPVAIAFNVANKEAVMRDLRQHDPGMMLLDAVDNDHSKQRNAGLEMGRKLEREVGAIPLVPKFAQGDKGTDWNDYAKKHGLGAVKQEMRSQVRDALVQRQGVTQERRQEQGQER